MKIAIIGASRSKEKSSNKAVRAYKLKHHVVFPINPNERKIEGLICYTRISEVPLDVDAVSLYLPPQIGIKVIPGIIKKKVKRVYLNPGSESKEIIDKLRQNKIEVLQVCSIKEIDVDPDTM